MPPSIAEKYEQILAADPRSRIFVELARALVERGEHERAIEICRKGLEHHPSSILGRVVWGRALLEAGDLPGAMDQFEIAIALEPGSPYGFNLIGETLLAKGLHREALPVLARAAELQPADPRVRGWLDEARRRARETQAEHAAAAAGAAANGHAHAHAHAQPPAAKPDPADDVTEVFSPLPPPGAAASEETARFALRNELGAPELELLTPAPMKVVAAAPEEPALALATDDPAPGSTPAGPVVEAAAAPHLPPIRPTPPSLQRDEIPRGLLSSLPATRPHPPAAAPPPATPSPDADEAGRIAARYEAEVRARLLASPEPPPPPLDRHRRKVFVAVAALAVAAAAATWWVVDARRTAALAETAAARARAGLARDTAGSLREAARLLAEARRRGSNDPAIRSLDAQVNAVLAAEHADGAARARAVALAADPETGDGALAVRYLLATTPAEQDAAAVAILGAPPSSEPLVQALAGRILARRGEREGGRGRLEIAARSAPPLLRALADLGDDALASGDAEGALSLHLSALAAHPTYPRAAVGAAEARLALGRDLEAAHKDLAAVEADEGSPPPVDLLPRYELAWAHVLSAAGEARAAAERLQKAQARLGERPELARALAEVHLAARAWDRAEAAAARAVALAPRDPEPKILLARARIGRGRFAEALAATEGEDGRAARVQRAIARYRRGELALARAELERTVHDGKMPSDAAAWYALTDVALGRADRALPLLEKLAAGRAPSALALAFLGRSHEALGQADLAERAYVAAVERDPADPMPRLALGALRLARGDATGAIPDLEKAVAADRSDPDARRALGAARLAAGQPDEARGELDAVLLAHPRDAEALRLLSAAWLAEKQPVEARRAAEQGLGAHPRDAGLLLAAARAAAAGGNGLLARGYAGRALKSGARGDDAAEARRIAGAGAAGGGARRR